jgi:hypothetical protein
MVEKITLDVGPDADVLLDNIGGDLRLSGRGEGRFEAQAAEGGELKVRRDGDRIRVGCQSGCLIFLPTGARVEAKHVGGDVRVTNISNEVLIRNVGGDVSLRRLGQAAFEMVGGDLQARDLEGALSLDRVGGDAVVEGVRGDVRLRSVGGDLMLRHVTGLIDLAAGGDVSLRYDPPAGSSSSVAAGGDLSCTLAEAASVKVELNAGGDLHTDVSPESGWENEHLLVLGDADAELRLTAGGDLWFRTGEAEFGEDLVGEIMGEVDARIAEMEARFGAIGAGMAAFDAERIGERVRRAVARAKRKASKARRKSAWKSGTKAKTVSFTGFADVTQPVTDEERMRILKMVEQGTITVEQAETLLEALEGES